MKKTKEEKGKQVMTDVKGLKALASRLRGSVTTVTGDTGRKYVELKPSVRDSTKLAEDILTVVKILKALAKADEFACVDDCGRLFHRMGFSRQARHAVFNSRLIAAGKDYLRIDVMEGKYDEAFLQCHSIDDCTETAYASIRLTRGEARKVYNALGRYFRRSDKWRGRT